jgi:hypothetical protein
VSVRSAMVDHFVLNKTFIIPEQRKESNKVQFDQQIDRRLLCEFGLKSDRPTINTRAYKEAYKDAQRMELLGLL